MQFDGKFSRENFLFTELNQNQHCDLTNKPSFQILLGHRVWLNFEDFLLKVGFFFIFSKDIYVIQTGGGMKPNDDLMELMFLINAFK